MADICVFGLGYVGLPTASLMANAGFQVLGIDIDPEVVKKLNKGETRLDEAGLSTLVHAAFSSGNLVASTKPEASDTFIICVPTPISEDKNVDLTAVRKAAESIKPHLRPGNLVILESTSPIGTTRGVVGKILEETGMEAGVDFDLCYCPERVLPGNTVNELMNNDRIVGGVTPESAVRAALIFERFSYGKVVQTNDLTAEMCKLMENTYRDVNIALANVFARIAEEKGVDVWEAIEHSNLHPRVNILSPGPGVGGHCFPIDPWFLIGGCPSQTNLLKAAREVNDSQPERLLERAVKAAGVKRNDKIAVLGAAYKPDIDDPRESPAHAINKLARIRDIAISVHDPHVKEGDHEGMFVTNDLESALLGAKAVLLVTNHACYRSLSARFFREHMAGNVIADGRNWLNHQTLRAAGFELLVVGEPQITEDRASSGSVRTRAMFRSH